MQKDIVRDFNCHIFFSESEIGIHRPKHFDKTEEVIMISGAFISNYTKEGTWSVPSKIIEASVQNKKKFESSGYVVNFLIGYDLDENGELMSHALRDALIANGIPPDSIYRTPLAENGYLGIMPFGTIDAYKEFRKKDVQFQKRNFQKTKRKLGILKVIALYFLQKNRGKKIKIKNSGNSTVTVVFNEMQKINFKFGAAND